ncbi:probable pectinesterase/pectinesterase inhibitor 20 [Coffea eugenioides]|uniref:probable pectinesterase/pectinesterase inhibitor 20 n=1 Tax=Coffea eugenioides TaxID=49369 RepID=UPI000F606B6E|nr:probable pectinesterase/pectinesterase inhibitor 20 [Coffea eugenioides]
MSISTFSLFLIIHSIMSPIHASSSFSKPTSSDGLCDITPYPDFCNSEMPQNKSTNIYDYGRLSIQKSLSTSQVILSAINRYLHSGSSSQSQTTIFALQDCKILLSSNVDLLSSVAGIIKDRDALQSSQYDDLETWLSATITSKQTCLEGLYAVSSAWAIANGLSPSLANGTMLCSVSLALVKHGWQSGGGSVNITKVVVVNPDGSGNYTTINDAISAAPNNTQAGRGYYLIHVVAGVYQEYISIASNKKYLMMVGDGINQTIITGNHSVGDGWTTFNSATFAVVAQGFVAVNLTFRNTAGAAKYQAVAVRNGADLSTFYNCSFEGYQDTLYTHSMRQFYRECDIYGTIDYIFGNAAVVFQLCNMYSRLPLQGQFNTITAQGKTDINQNTGTSILDCNILAATDLSLSNATVQTYLGRPWKNYSTTVYMESFMDSLINPAGWAAWSGDFALSTLYYAEYNNSGPGSNTANRVTWPGYHVITSASAVVNFTVSIFISGDFWLPATGVPYIGGFLYA